MDRRAGRQGSAVIAPLVDLGRGFSWEDVICRAVVAAFPGQPVMSLVVLSARPQHVKSRGGALYVTPGGGRPSPSYLVETSDDSPVWIVVTRVMLGYDALREDGLVFRSNDPQVVADWIAAGIARDLA